MYCIVTAQAEGKDWRASLPNTLLQYRTTPHRITGQTPAQMLFQTEMRTKVPTIGTPQREDTDVRGRDARAKEKAKKYTDEKRHASPRNLKVGDLALVTQRKQNKFTTRFRPDPMTITGIHGTQLVLMDGHGRQ